MYPDQLSDPRQGVLTTGRMESTGQVVFQRGLQLPALQPGTSDVVVNGVDYRVRTIPVDQQGGVLISIGIRADSILLSRARIPFYVAVGLVTVLIAAGRGLAVVRTRDPTAAQADRTHQASRQRDRGDARSSRRPRGRGTVRGDDGHAQPDRRRTAGHPELAAGRAGFRGERRTRVAHPVDRDAGRLGHVAHSRPARRGAGRGGQRPVPGAATRRGDHHRAGSTRLRRARAGRGPRSHRRDRPARPGGQREHARRAGR